jgi:serine/threonine-protein kinase
MAPEQAAGDPVDARSDLYALGVVLYELVTGQVPFNAPTPIMVLLKHVYELPPPPRSLNPNLPAPVEAAVLRALAKEPFQRYQSAAEMSAELEHLIEQLKRPTVQVALGGSDNYAGSLGLSHAGAQVMPDDTVAAPPHAGETRHAIASADDQVTRLAAPGHAQTIQAGGTKGQRGAAQRAGVDAAPRHLVISRVIRSGRMVVSLIALVAATIVLVGSGSVLAMRSVPTPAVASAMAPTLLVVTATATATPTDVPTATPTAIPTATPTATATATATATPTATAIPTATSKPKPRPRPTETPPLPTEVAPPPTEVAPSPTAAPPPPTTTPRKERRTERRKDAPPPKPPAP